MVFESKIIDKHVREIIFCVKFVLTLSVDYYVPYVWVNFIASMVSVFLLSCCYRAPLWKKIVVSIEVNMMLAVSETLVALMINNEIFGLFSKASNEQSIALVLSRIIFWMIFAIVKQLNAENRKIKFSKKICFFEAVVIVTVLGELIIVYTQGQMSIWMESLLLLGAEITIYLLIYLYDCLVTIFDAKIQAEIIQKEKEYYHREALMLQENQESIKQFRHDWKNRVQVIGQLVETQKWEELKEYLSEVENRMVAMQLYSNTGNLAVDSIINCKMYQAIKKKIKISVNVLLPNEITIESDDIVVILGNVLDNAIEACEYVREEKYIELNFWYDGGCIFLHVCNSFDEVLNIKNGEYITRKKDKSMHGVGIKSVKNTVEKYNGITEITTKKNKFIVNIMMYV